MAEVFISYARGDAAVARLVAKALSSDGLDVWWDADLPAHRSYSEVIEAKLAEAKAVVVLWSKVAAQSQWVRAEADFARSAGKLVQANVDGTMPPMPFNQIQCAELKNWRGKTSHDGWRRIASSVRALALPSDAPPATTVARPPARPRVPRWAIAAAAILALVLAAGWYLTLGKAGNDRKPVLAVMPFTAVDARDAGLVGGMWEDTRRAIGRNPQLIVLGPNTVAQLADKGPQAAGKAADYLLNASVRSANGRIRVSADLVNAKDGSQLWSQSFDRKLDDVFALQSELAGEIEGRIRGRLAQRGGIRAEQIATSGDVYALYSDARAKLRKRDRGLVGGAREQLQQVVKMDPNFAPGWAALSVAESLTSPSKDNGYTFSDRAEPNARRAIELAPNLSAGHAALAVALWLKGPVARAEIERAVKLDPSDYESLHWLAISLIQEGKTKEALKYFERARKIEPLFAPAVVNEFQLLVDLGDDVGAQRLLDEQKRLGSPYLVTTVEMETAKAKGDYARAIRLGADYWQSGATEGRAIVGSSLWSALLHLGYFEQALKVQPTPDFAFALWNDDPKGLDAVELNRIPPSRYFTLNPLPANSGRVYVLSGRGAKLAQMYLSLGVAPTEFEKIMDDHDEFLIVAPLVATALRGTGNNVQAGALLAAAEDAAPQNPARAKPGDQAMLARIYAAQGRKDQAAALLETAVRRGWLPSLPELQTDIDKDPVLAPLRTDPRYARIRQQILTTVARQRAALGPVVIR